MGRRPYRSATTKKTCEKREGCVSGITFDAGGLIAWTGTIAACSQSSRAQHSLACESSRSDCQDSYDRGHGRRRGRRARRDECRSVIARTATADIVDAHVGRHQRRRRSQANRSRTAIVGRLKRMTGQCHRLLVAG